MPREVEEVSTAIYNEYKTLCTETAGPKAFFTMIGFSSLQYYTSIAFSIMHSKAVLRLFLITIIAETKQIVQKYVQKQQQKPTNDSKPK